MPHPPRPPASPRLVDRLAFEAIYDRYADELYRFCLRRSGNRAIAEDVRATVFLETWRRRGEIDLTSRPLGPWLYAVARNILRNQIRTERRDQTRLQSLGSIQAGHAVDAAEQVQRDQATRALLVSLRTLPLAQRQVVALCLFQDRSYEAAADELRIPVGTVRSRLARARLHLAADIRALETKHQDD